MAKPRLLCLGDSYTIGESVSAGETWPAQLANRLLRAGINVETTVVAKTGWTTDELAQAIDATPLRRHYDLVSLLIGVNNQYRSRSIDEFARHYALLLAFSIDRAAGHADRVLGISIPDWSHSEFGRKDARGLALIGQQIDQFNAVSKAICVAAGVPFVDITANSRTDHQDFIAADGLHPSGLAYAQWVRQIFPLARRQLAASDVIVR